MPWGFAAAAVGTIAGAAISSNGAKSAANTQAQAAREANATQLAMYDQTREDNAPALDARNASLQKMRELLGIGGDANAQGYGSLSRDINVGDVTKDPGYQFGLNEGMRGLNNQLTARGMRNSGAALKQAERYATDYASTKYGDAFNRLQGQQTNQFNRFASVSGLGQTGANMVGSAGQNYANQVGSTQQSLGNALGASSIAQANTWGNAANQLGGWYGSQQRGGGGSQNVPMYQQDFVTTSD